MYSSQATNDDNETMVSVIVPIYNTERYLHRCLDSILAQSYKDFELLLIDDELRDAINNHLSGTQLLDIAVKNGMVPLLDDGLAKVEQKITTKAEILRIAAGVQ